MSPMRSGSQRSFAKRPERGDLRVARVGHVERTLREDPCHPAVDRAERQVARPLRILDVEDRLDLRRAEVRREDRALARAARGTARPSGGPASRCRGRRASPVVRSHTTVDARWLAMPTPSTGPASSSARRASSSTTPPIAVASNSTSPGAGESGRSGARCSTTTCASASTTALRTDDVPTSTTSTRPCISSTSRCVSHRQEVETHGRCVSRPYLRRKRNLLRARRGSGPKGLGSPSLPGLRIAVRVERLLGRDEHVERRAERLAHEPGPVEPDTVMVAQRTAVSEDRTRPRVPRVAVVARSRRRSAGWLAREGEVEAGTVGVGVRLVRRHDDRVVDGLDRGGRRGVDVGQRRAIVRRSPSCRRRTRAR